jgi:hypothetical protein
MGARRVSGFVQDREGLWAFRQVAKLRACPHCGCVGALNAHGPVHGYAEGGSERVLRGHRFFCSNRHRRPGCGRTFMVRLSQVLQKRVVRTGTLWRFVLAVVAGVSRKAAWESTGAHVLTLRSGYRLWHRFTRAGPAIRTRLLSLCPPPPCRSRLPLSQLSEHLRHALPSSDALAAFQRHFQLHLLG